MIYVRSELYRKTRKKAEKPMLFGEKEGRIALANRRKDPLYLFSALQRHLGYPAVPQPKPEDSERYLLPALQRRDRAAGNPHGALGGRASRRESTCRGFLRRRKGRGEGGSTEYQVPSTEYGATLSIFLQYSALRTQYSVLRLSTAPHRPGIWRSIGTRAAVAGVWAASGNGSCWPDSCR